MSFGQPQRLGASTDRRSRLDGSSWSRGRGFVAVFVLMALIGAQLGWLPTVAVAAPNQSVIVVLKRGANPKRVANEMGVKITQVYHKVFNGFAGTLPAAAAAARAKNPNVEIMVDDTPIEAAGQSIPNGIDRVEADVNLDASIDGAEAPTLNVDVAVLDSGIDPDHPDLNVVGGHDCTGKGSYGDDNDHGTHVAGTIAARDNGRDVVGVAPGARLWAVKVLDAENRYSSSSVLICGLDWVLSQGAKIDVINMSLGGAGSDGACATSALHQAICTTVNTYNIPVVVAAMNNSRDASGFVPATYAEVITVSAYSDSDGKPGGNGGPLCISGNQDDRFADFSNYGADIDIAAPGTCIRSTARGGGTWTMWGTSMATPHVTGAIALYKAKHPSATAAAVRTWLLGTAAKPQSSPEGFTGDPDGNAEPVLNLDFGDADLVLDPSLEIVANGQSTKSIDGVVAYDENDDSSWMTTGVEPRMASVWFDLGTTRSITAIRWKFNKLGNADRFKIQVSDDFLTWQTIAIRHNAASPDAWQTIVTGASGRYVRFQFINRNDDRRVGYLSEVTIHGTSVDATAVQAAESGSGAGGEGSTGERGQTRSGNGKADGKHGRQEPRAKGGKQTAGDRTKHKASQ